MGSDRPPKTLLLIDDDQLLCDAIKDSIGKGQIEVHAVRTGAEGLAFCARRRVDVVLLDQKLPDVSGHSLCASILKPNEMTKIVFITGYPSMENAVEAVRAGAYDYLSKPFELEELRLVVERAFKALEMENAMDLQSHRSEKENQEAVLVGRGLDSVRVLVNLAASTPGAPVLITGETGTGKNVVAKAIHHKGPTHSSPFVAVNCAALPESLIEAELFGYERGAFTGATSAKRGLFELAEGGSLLLDEIADLPLHLQSKLLGVLEERAVRRVGGELVRPVDVRVIAATNRNLEEAFGRALRMDLYYRLSVMRVHIPPLRDRREDIPELCQHLLERTAGGGMVQLPDTELEKLMQYDWPGNVRELKNILERAVVLRKESPVWPSELLGMTDVARPPMTAAGTVLPLEEVEKRSIKDALEALGYNYTRAAKALGISLSTLKRKVGHYGLRPGTAQVERTAASRPRMSGHLE
ncbi:MAG: sigma-54 dependent transcriptional regulator [Acidobacteriota bacterium]